MRARCASVCDDARAEPTPGLRRARSRVVEVDLCLAARRDGMGWDGHYIWRLDRRGFDVTGWGKRVKGEQRDDRTR